MIIQRKMMVGNFFVDPQNGVGQCERALLTPLKGASAEEHEFVLPLTSAEAMELPFGALITITIEVHE